MNAAKHLSCGMDPALTFQYGLCVWLHNFGTFTEARTAITKWIEWYKAGRPHQSLGYRSPRQFRALQTRGLKSGVHIWTQPRAQGCCSVLTVRLRACIRPLDEAPSASGHDGNPHVFAYNTTSASWALLP